MAVSVSKAQVWSGTLFDKPGALDAILAQLAAAGVNLDCIIARRQPPGMAHVYLTPVKGAKAQAAARAAGLAPTSNIFTLCVKCDNKKGACHAVMQDIAAAGINVRGMSAVGSGKTSTAYIGFDSAADADKAATAIKAGGRAKR